MRLSKKSRTKIAQIAVLCILGLLILVGTAYGAVIILGLPVNLPFIMTNEVNPTVPSESLTIINQYNNATYRQPGEDYSDIQQSIETADVPEINIDGVMSLFSVIDKASLEKYISENEECLSGGYAKLFIDEADLMGTPTGIKTTVGDDVLTLDVLDGIMIIGRDIEFEGGTTKVKLAISSNAPQLDFSVVKDINYWETVDKHVDRGAALLGINASSYNWSGDGSDATLIGAVKHRGSLIRKIENNQNLVCFNGSGQMVIGGDINSAYNAFEASQVLIKDGQTIYRMPTDEEIAQADGQGVDIRVKESRSAQSALGQTADGRTLLLVSSGGVYGSNLGATYSEVANMFKQYNCNNAVMLSGGSRAIMYWNGRVLNETVDYPENGVVLPNAILVKSKLALPTESDS